MALSKSLQKGQAPLSCQMCEDSTEIKWKCLTCELLMCTKCRKIHQKVKSSNEHNIIDIKDIALHQESGSRPDFSYIKCPSHKGQSLCLFCTDCSEGICPTCVAKMHTKHSMIELSDGYKISVQKIKNKYDTIEEHALKLTEGMSTLELVKSNGKTSQNKEKQEIKKQEMALIDAIKGHTNKLLNEIDNKCLSLNSNIQHEQDNASKILLDLGEKKRILGNAINSTDAREIFRILKDDEDILTEKLPSVSTQFKQLPVFEPGIIQGPGIESMFGSLKDKSIPLLKMELKVVQQYTTDFPCVYDIACCYGSMWINNINNDNLRHVTLCYDSIQVNRQFHVKVADMALTSSGDLLLSTRAPELQIITHQSLKVQKSKYNIAPLITVAVHVPKNNKVMIGARESGPAHPSNGRYGPRKLIVMNDKGDKEKEYQYDNNHKPLFRNVYRITTDSEGYIYVIDVLSDDFGGRVVVLEGTGLVRGVYDGHGVVKKDKLFKPCNIKTTESDVTIVTDYNNHLLHFLDNKGQCLKYYNTKELGFEFPLSLDINNKGRLYIGCDTYKGQPEKAKIIELQLE